MYEKLTGTTSGYEVDLGGAAVAGRVVYTDAAGKLTTEAALAYNASTNTLTVDNITSNAATNLVLKSAGTTALTLSATAVTSALPVLHPDGTAGAPTLAFSGEGGTGFYRSGTQQLSWATAGGEYVRFNTTAISFLTDTFLVRLGASADVLLTRGGAAGRLKIGNATGGGLTINVATTTLASVTGASVTATNLVPARAQVIGVATYVTVALGTGSGTTGYTVGDGTDADRFGAVTGTIVGTDTDSSTDATADPRMTWSTSAQNIVITAAGGNFDGNGTIRVEVYYLGDSAPTS